MLLVPGCCSSACPTTRATHLSQTRRWPPLSLPFCLVSYVGWQDSSWLAGRVKGQSRMATPFWRSPHLHEYCSVANSAYCRSSRHLYQVAPSTIPECGPYRVWDTHHNAPHCLRSALSSRLAGRVVMISRLRINADAHAPRLRLVYCCRQPDAPGARR
jgi:hypothetical protein